MSSHNSCRMCASPLAIDQRYCVECGQRARPVPRWAAAALGLIRTDEPARPAATAPARSAKPAPIRFGPLVIPWSAPSPRAAAISVLSVLSFGVAVGAAGISTAGLVLLGGGSQQSSASTQLQASVAPVNSGGQSVSPGQSSQSPTTSPTPTTGSTPATSTPTAPTTTTGSGTTTTPGTLPPIKYVWLITLGDAGYSQTFSPTSGDSYLSQTLPRKGELLAAYYADATGDLANEVAVVSGQGPNLESEADCPIYDTLKPGNLSASAGQVLGDGCVFPKSTQTLAGQLTAAGKTWKAYVQGLGSVAKSPSSGATSTGTSTTTSATTTATGTTTTSTGTATTTSSSTTAAATDPTNVAAMQRLIARLFGPESARSSTASSTRRAAARSSRARRRARPHVATNVAASCRHPALGSTDGFQATSTTSSYVTWKNPFVYFQSITGSSACANDDVGTGQLLSDLKSAQTTPNMSFIYADPCDDGTASPCQSGESGGTSGADSFLQAVIPAIMASPAYKSGDGLILITFDQAPQSGANASQASYDLPTYPNIPTTTTGTTTSTTTGTTDTTGTDTTSTTDTTATDTTVTAVDTTGTTDTTGTDTGTTDTGTETTGTTNTGTNTTGTSTTTSFFCTANNPTDANGNPCTGGGGQVGLLAISKCIKPATTDAVDGGGNNFTLLASLEKLFGLKYLGYAGTSMLGAVQPGFYSDYSAATGVCGAASSSGTG